MSKVDDMINKSLDEIDSIVAEIKKGNADTDLSKATADEDLSPEDVAEDTPDADDDNAGDDAGDEPTGDDAGEGDDADVDNDEEPEQDTEDNEFEKSLKSDDGVRKALEVSGFLSGLAKSLGDIIEGHSDKLNKSLEASDHSNQLLAKSFEGIVKSQRVVLETQAELLKSLRVISKRVKTLEEQPLVRKSVSNAKAVDKPFTDSTGATAPTGAATLSKSQISAKLFQAVQESKVPASELLAFESLGSVNALSDNTKAAIGIK
jgi:hypothetical protein